MYQISINDELQELKKSLAELDLSVLKIEKVGNGNMSAFRLELLNNKTKDKEVHFFWRHDMETFISKMKNSHQK